MSEPISNRGRFFEGSSFLIQKIEYDANGNAIYVGSAAPGSATSDAAWLIVKYTYDGNNLMTASGFAGADIGFKKIWDNRGTYDYS